MDNIDDGWERAFLVGLGFVGAVVFAEEADSDPTLALEEFEEGAGLRLFRYGHAKGDENAFAVEASLDLTCDGGGIVRLYVGITARAVGLSDFREVEFEIIIHLRDRADGGTCRFDVVHLLDGDGWWDAFDAIDQGFVHAVEELPRVGREGFDIASLAFGIDGLEGERGFARTTRAGDDREFVDRDVDIDALEVVLTRAANANG